jgi:hypothetical protein
MNKHTVVLFVFGLAVGVLATSARRQLASFWPWAGAADRSFYAREVDRIFSQPEDLD